MNHDAGERELLVANPSADVYGSDLQLLESVTALVAARWRTTVAVPDDGPLVELLERRGATIRFVDFPVLRRMWASPGGVIRLAVASSAAVMRMRSLIRERRPSVVYVNTVTLPWWLAASRLAGVPAICHVHEAEVRDSLRMRKVLVAPLAAASLIIANGIPAQEEITTTMPRLGRKTRLVRNGVAPAPGALTDALLGSSVRLLVVGRLSPRKAPDVALEALSILRARGVDAQLELCGSAFAGYEWFVERLRARADEPDVRGHVTFSGYVNPIWPALARADVVVAPSLGESFGNVVVQAMSARRPVVATAVQGHLDTVRDGVTGLLVPPSAATAISDAVERLLGDPDAARSMAAVAQHEASKRFSLDRYQREIVAAVDAVARRRSDG